MMVSRLPDIRRRIVASNEYNPSDECKAVRTLQTHHVGAVTPSAKKVGDLILRGQDTVRVTKVDKHGNPTEVTRYERDSHGRHSRRSRSD